MAAKVQGAKNQIKYCRDQVAARCDDLIVLIKTDVGNGLTVNPSVQ